MFSLLHEVLSSMSRNKLRVALTGFSIAFGIFMLIVLMGAGNGLLNGITQNFGTMTNSMQLWGGWTSMEWQGMPRRRSVKLDDEHFKRVVDFYDSTIDQYVPTISKAATLVFGHKSRSVELSGVSEQMIELTDIKMTAGRWLNANDQRECRKVCVIDKATAEVLFSGLPPTECIGQWLSINNIAFQLVGIYAASNSRSRDIDAYCPFTTMAVIYSGSTRELSSIRLSLKGLETAEQNADFERSLRRTMAYVESYNPADEHAIWVWNKAEDYLETMKMMRGMRILIWIIGVASLMAGVVGISNIMLITVRERTREFGIRMAIGARPRSILTLVLAESTAITLLFGYIGMLAGVGLMQLVASALAAAPSPEGEMPTMFINPTVDIGVVLAANVIMVVAGLIAGYIPARKATQVKPVEALSA